MKVLVACEESQEVCKAFRERECEAYSCDIQSCSGGHPEWHIMGDCLPLINGNCDFITQSGDHVHIDTEWDLLIAHPPCTYLTCTGNSWFNIEKYGEKAKKRWADREKAFDFFMEFVNAKCKHIAIENPIGYVSSHYRKPDQIIQPYWFGEDARKATCLWLKGLPPLEPTNIIPFTLVKTGHGTDSPWHAYTWSLPKEERAKARSKTFHGVAQAMGEQWKKAVESYMSITTKQKDETYSQWLDRILGGD
jgi:hypothetical protein